jgi:hypothetical protein
MITYCPTIIRGDFNIYKLDQNSTQPNELKFFMNHCSMELQFLKKNDNLWYPYWSHMDKCTHTTIYVWMCWSILDWSQINIICIQIVKLCFTISSHKLNIMVPEQIWHKLNCLSFCWISELKEKYLCQNFNKIKSSTIRLELQTFKY